MFFIKKMMADVVEIYYLQNLKVLETVKIPDQIFVEDATNLKRESRVILLKSCFH